MENYARVVFDSGSQVLNLASLELQYEARVSSRQLVLESNEVVLHPGSVIDLSGGGHVAGTGPGAGSQVHHIYFWATLIKIRFVVKFG